MDILYGLCAKKLPLLISKTTPRSTACICKRVFFLVSCHCSGY
ncbi:hypothetical protein fragment 1 [Helicobacter acinonychis str. Sheeba]|uniref:Uncharacterized protein n=1 Tax=Helicobacter acinonychis (strain Sheeba) TaxID=382638 RepID=Q17XH6_HELAH|nr:hypothetical protein fragment 1 [Helicobacter acinonychis str. Sheeba]